MNDSENRLSDRDFLLAASDFYSTVSELQEAAALLSMMASYIGDTGDIKEWRAAARIHSILDTAVNDAQALCDLFYRYAKSRLESNDGQEVQK